MKLKLYEAYTHHKNFTPDEMLTIFVKAKEVMTKLTQEREDSEANLVPLANVKELSVFEKTILLRTKENPLYDFILISKPFIAVQYYTPLIRLPHEDVNKPDLMPGSLIILSNAHKVLRAMEFIESYIMKSYEVGDKKSNPALLRQFEAIFELISIGYAPIEVCVPGGPNGQPVHSVDFVALEKRKPDFVSNMLANIEMGDFRKIPFNALTLYVPYNISNRFLDMERAIYKFMYEILSVMVRYARLKYWYALCDRDTLLALPDPTTYRMEYEVYDGGDYAYTVDEYNFYKAIVDVMRMIENASGPNNYCYSTYLHTIGDGFVRHYTYSNVVGPDASICRVYALDGDTFESLVINNAQLDCEYLGKTKDYRTFENGLDMFRVKLSGFDFDITFVLDSELGKYQNDMCSCSAVPSTTIKYQYGYNKFLIRVKDNKVLSSKLDIYNIFTTLKDRM